MFRCYILLTQISIIYQKPEPAKLVQMDWLAILIVISHKRKENAQMYFCPLSHLGQSGRLKMYRVMHIKHKYKDTILKTEKKKNPE